MKTKVKQVIILIALFGMMGSNEAWAYAVNYMNLRTEVASTSTGTGKVYAATSSNPDTMQYKTPISYTDSIWISKDDLDSGNRTRTFYAFAKPDKGFRFAGWHRKVEENYTFVSDQIPYSVTLVDTTTTYVSYHLTSDTLYAFFENSSTTSVTFPDATVTTADITDVKNTTVDVTIGRTFKRNGTNHTICLPFYLDSEELLSCPLAGFNKLQTFELAEIKNPGEENETLVLTMKDVKVIEAGKPYLIAWPNGGEDIVNPTFEDATITTDQADAVVSGDVSFCGTLVPYAVEKDDKGILFVGTQGVLNWPDVGGSIKAFRSYFSLTLDQGTSAPIRRGMAARLGEEKKMPTDLQPAVTAEDTHRATVQKLLEQGKVLILSDGIYYDMNGRIVNQ